jgi:hypothetical protein
MIIVNIIFFLQKISKEYEKENQHFHVTKKAFPIIKSRINEHDYWISRNSLLSKTGMFLLFQGFISFIWAYMITEQFNYYNHTLCDLNIQRIINAHSFFILYVNIFVLIVFAIVIINKAIFYVLGHYFPNAFVFISKISHRKKSNIKTYHRVDYNSYFHKLAK